MFSFMTPWVKRLLIANVVVFVITLAMPRVTDLLLFQPASAFYRPWTFVTYMFVHGGYWHIIFNMITLAFFGPRVEAQLGSGRFIVLYFLSGLGGALLSFITPMAMIVGASGAIFGVELAYAMIWPRDKILIWGVLPVEARWLVIGQTVYSVYAGFGGYGGGVAHFAHLGGYVAAFIFLKWIDHKSPLRSYQRKLDSALYGKKGTLPVGLLGDTEELAKWEAIPRDGLHSMNLEELDRVLDKARREGVRSLTPDERAYLHRLSLRGPAPADGSQVS
jgi:membrane associated rhomboid family serine protease